MPIKAWQRVTGSLNIEVPEEKELAERFDQDFIELIKAVPKANRRVLIDMVDTLSDLYTNAVNRNWSDGYKLGVKQGCQKVLMKGLSGTLKIMDHSITKLKEEVTTLIS